MTGKTNTNFKQKKLLSSCWVLLLDVCISLSATFIAIMFYRWQNHAVPGFEQYVFEILCVSLISSILAILLCKSHLIVIRYSSIKSLGKLIAAICVKTFLLVAMIHIFSEHFSKVNIGWAFVMADMLITSFLMVLSRLAIITIYEKLDDDIEVNVGKFNVIVYGVTDKAASLVTRLDQSTHYNILGFLSPNESDAGHVLADYKVYNVANTESLKNLKVALGFDGILFARNEDAEEEKENLIPMAVECGIHILTTPKISEINYSGISRNTIQAISDSDFIPDGMTAFQRQFKRSVDLVLSSILLIIFSPIMLACAIAIKLKGGDGPIIYKQERIGRFGRPFNIYKFRTMRNDSEANGPTLYKGDDDPRLTKIGKFLRVHHLDEMPQLFNVFRGDMAFVGYRPERKFYIDQIMQEDPRYYYLYQIRPGVTSYATLKNGYTDSMGKMLRRLEFDLYYLRNRSMMFDIRILAQTFLNIVFGKKF